MKRILSCAVCISVLCSLVGCNSIGDGNVDKLIKTAFTKTETAKNINTTIETNMSIDFDSYTYSAKSVTEQKECNRDATEEESAKVQSKVQTANPASTSGSGASEDSTVTYTAPIGYEMSTDILVQSMGKTENYEEFYKDGFYYTNRYGGNFKTKMKVADLRKDKISGLTKVEYADMKSTEITKNVDSSADSSDILSYSGCTKIVFECKNAVIKKYLEQSFGTFGKDYDDITVKRGRGTYLINANGYLIRQTLSVAAEITVDGKATTASVNTSVTMTDMEQGVDPYDPEEEAYTEIDDISTVAELNSAMSKSLSAEDVNLTMNTNCNVTLNKVTTGYKRDYERKLSASAGEYMQTVKTTYTNGKSEGKPVYSCQYYTDGAYYSRSDVYGQKIKSTMEFATFFTNIFAAGSRTPADNYAPKCLKNINVKKDGEEKVFSFDVNTDCDDGKTVVASFFGPFTNFSGDVNSSKITVKNFSGKSYIDKNGNYYKTELNCDITVKFEEGTVRLKTEQTVNVINIGEKLKFKFPEFIGYEKMKAEDLISAYSGDSAATASIPATTTGNGM